MHIDVTSTAQLHFTRHVSPSHYSHHAQRQDFGHIHEQELPTLLHYLADDNAATRSLV
jgi:hypothetical protein